MPSIADLCRGLPVVAFEPGAVLLEEGASTGRLYVLIEGAVEVLKGGVQVSVTTDRGAIFGDMSALLGIPHTASVRAVHASSAYLIEGGEAFLKDHQEVAYQLAKLLAQRLLGVTAYLADLKRQFEDRDDHLSMVDDILETLIHDQRGLFTPGSDREPD